MNLLDKIKNYSNDFVQWYSSPWTTFEKIRKSPVTIILVLLFISVPMISFYVNLVTDYNWIEQKLHPKVSFEQQEIDVINQKLKDLGK